ncbi:MFS transporter [Nocardiopsis sp. TNDT3]|uniref:MFS transporter n=1 Tax=Nocardiopsis sp. TNDT3 TaxID=2249354 RepID=UPI000E3D1E15|nr:MFS transporter [Nocardiopsis sp. TNDT3]
MSPARQPRRNGHGSKSGHGSGSGHGNKNGGGDEIGNGSRAGTGSESGNRAGNGVGDRAGSGNVLSRTTARGAAALRDVCGLPALPLLLIGSQFAFNVGFFAVLPYLADHLGGALGLAGWLVGLVLGLRTFSQQGLFVVGGTLTDRFGARPVVLAGCALRVAGFCWLGFAQGTASVIASVLLIGFAAALFSPAVETEIVRQAVRHERRTGEPRTRMLALFSVAGQAGTLVGPPLGALLLLGGFRAACLAGAAVFAAVLAGHLRLMPRTAPGAPASADRGTPRLREGLRLLLGNRRFLALSLAYSGYLLAYNQLYLALPAEVERATGSQTALGWLLAWASLLYIVTQMPMLRWASARLTRRATLVWGLVLICLGFAGAAASMPVGALGGLVPSAVFVTALTLGQVLIVPTVRAWIPDLVEDRHLGLFTGALSSLSGLVVLLGSVPAGALLDLGGPLPWLLLALVPLAGAVLAPGRGRP